MRRSKSMGTIGKEKLAMVMRENEIEWDQKGTHEPHLSVLDYKKKVREQEVEELTEHKNLLEHDLHDISKCMDEIQRKKNGRKRERCGNKKDGSVRKTIFCTKFKSWTC